MPQIIIDRLNLLNTAVDRKSDVVIIALLALCFVSAPEGSRKPLNRYIPLLNSVASQRSWGRFVLILGMVPPPPQRIPLQKISP